jgi:hypothetical protein
MSSMSEERAIKPQKRRPHRKTRMECILCKRRKIVSNLLMACDPESEIVNCFLG